MRTQLAVFSLIAALGCAADGKGGEDNALGDGKADSFYSPTDHGPLSFTLKNLAEITADEQFHAWTFELTGSASFSLVTAPEKNLDTVMYLYRRDAGSTGSWGSYMEKNDDWDDEMYSRIDFDGDAGEYRVIVKGFKSAHRGKFSLEAQCSGAGCPSATCSVDAYDPLPYSTDFTQSCADSLLQALSSANISTHETSVEEDDICSLSPSGKRAVDIYRAYWDEMVGWEDFIGSDPVELEIADIDKVWGHETDIDITYNDEGGMTLLFDADENLVTLYQHNQSPDQMWFCGTQGQPSIEPPDDNCMVRMFDAFEHEDQMEIVGSVTASCDNFDEPYMAGVPLCEFAAEHGLDTGDDLDIDYRVWTTPWDREGGEITVTGGGATATHFVGTTSADTSWIFATVRADGTTFDCISVY